MSLNRKKLGDIADHSVPVNLILLIMLIVAMVVSASLAFYLWHDKSENYVREEQYQKALDRLEDAHKRARELKYKDLLNDARNKNHNHFDTLFINASTTDSARRAIERENIEFIKRLGLDKGLPE